MSTRDVSWHLLLLLLWPSRHVCLCSGLLVLAGASSTVEHVVENISPVKLSLEAFTLTAGSWDDKPTPTIGAHGTGYARTATVDSYPRVSSGDMVYTVESGHYYNVTLSWTSTWTNSYRSPVVDCGVQAPPGFSGSCTYRVEEWSFVRVTYDFNIV